MPRGSNRPYEGDLRRDLLDAAIAVVSHEDPANLSLRAIARQLGVSHAAPKNHFADKTELLTAIAVEGFAKLGQAMVEARMEADTAIDGMRASGEAYMRFSIENPGYFRVMWRNELLCQEDERLEGSGRAVFAGLQESVAAAQREGWGADLSAEDLAVAAWSAVHGMAQLYLDGPLPKMDGREPAVMAAGLSQVLVLGLTANGTPTG
ncbi:MAG: TetR/AcrR family transcriptional regulator [Myxococcota bacterium]